MLAINTWVYEMGIEQAVQEQQGLKVSNADWEIILTDPSLNKFNFGGQLPDDYIMTDIISPMGQKSILYSSLPKSGSSDVIIGLNLFDVDQANVSLISIKSVKQFFDVWRVVLIDYINDESYTLNNEDTIQLEKPLNVNKLFGVGFDEVNSRQLAVPFELLLHRKK